MSTPPTTAAWEADDFWKEAVAVMTNGKKLRSDAYLQTLSAEELDDLQLVLLSPLPLQAQRDSAPKWRGGPNDGNPPSVNTLSELGQALRQVNMLRNLERQQAMKAATSERLNGLGLDSALVDTVLTVMSEEALRRAAAGMADKTLSSAATALLRRQALNNDSRRIKLLEEQAAQAVKAKKVTEDETLTPEQRQLKMREIFGMT